TISADGEYSYARNESTPGDVSDVFTYTLTDGDDDTDTATLTITIADAGVGFEDLEDDQEGDGVLRGSDIFVNESKLAGGTGVGDGAAEQTGTFTVSSPDGIANLSITQGGNTVTLVTDNVVHDFTEEGPLVITTALGNTLSITSFDPETGEVGYTYTLLSSETHEDGDGRNDLFESFTVTLEDMDGDDTTGTLGVRIVDDVPVIEQTGVGLDNLTVSEASLDTPTAAVDFSAAFTYQAGADGKKSHAYSLVVNGDSGLKDVLTGDDIVLVANSEGTLITGHVAGDPDAVAFTISINDQSGAVTLTQMRALKHGEEDDPSDNLLSIAAEALSLRLTVTDSDDDTTTSTVDNIGGHFTFQDDTPTISSEAGNLGTIELDETSLVAAAGNPITITEADFATGVFSPDYGSDEAAASDALVYSLEVTNGAATGLTDAVTDEAILLRLNGGTGVVEAYTATGNQLVFTVAVDAATGALTLTQHRAIEHGDTADHNEVSTALAANLINLVATATDGDGDSTSASVGIGDRISFLDDGPAVGEPPSITTVNEVHLPFGSAEGQGSLTVSGGLNLTVSADGIDTRFSDDLTDILEARGLKSSSDTPLAYSLSENGHILTATAGEGGPVVFTVTITDPASASAGYEFTLSGALDHDGAESLDLEFSFVVTDGDGDTATGSFTVKVKDDPSVDELAFTIDEDHAGHTFNTTADATPENTVIHQADPDNPGGPALELPVLTTHPDGSKDYKTTHGIVTVNANGQITYKPDPNYSGTEIFKYVITDGDESKTTEVTMTVHPVSDAPALSVVAEDIDTPEDVSVALGLNAPVIVDDGEGGGNNPVSERLGTITLDGFPEGAKLQDGDGNTLHVFNSGAPAQSVTIWLSDGDMLDATAPDGALSMTIDEFEALWVLPPEHSHENFTVTMTVSSYEVDADGNRAQVDGTDVPGADSSIDVDVDVRAVTDEPVLTLDDSVDAADVGAKTITVTAATEDDNAKIAVTMYEDQTLELQSVLQEALADMDGSETLWYGITGLPPGTQVMIGTQTYTAGPDGSVNSSLNKFTVSGAQNPVVSITPPLNYSNSDPIDAQITLYVQDTDDDSPGHTANVQSITVDLALRVYAVPDDVTLANPPPTEEDTSVTFLQNLALTDTDESETIIQVRITDLPSEGGVWKLFDHNGIELSIPPGGDENNGGLVLTIGTGGSHTLEEIKQFTLLPPGHSSSDGTITVYVTTQEDGENTESGSPETTEWAHDLSIVVTPVGEEIDPGQPGGDTDGDGAPDLVMSGDHDYSTPGLEDTWFKLYEDPEAGAVNPLSGWSNQDGADEGGNEKTWARLTPEVASGSAIGSKFQWSTDGGSTWVEETYVGTPIDVPVEYLDTLQFMAPPNFAGMFEIKVEARTVDYDDDDGTPSSEAVSGAALLTNILVVPVADAVTLAVNGKASGLEDTLIPLRVTPTSSDPSETFTVTISGIPAGAVVYYGDPDSPLQVSTGGTIEIENFDSTVPLHIMPPLHSNIDFSLNVSAVSVDTLTVGGNNYSSTSLPDSLDIDVTVKGVADEVTVNSTPQTWAEADLDGKLDAVSLSDLVTFTKVDTDPTEAFESEKLTIRVSGLPEGFSPNVGTPLTAPGVTGEDRVWLLTEAQLATAEINVPANYSGTVTFQVTPVTTENDGHSLTGEPVNVSFTVTPSPEATVTTSATLVEDVITSLGFDIVHQNGDNDEVLAEVRIKQDYADGNDFTLYLGNGDDAPTLAEALNDGDITQVADGGVMYYVLTGEQAKTLAAKGGEHLDDDLGGFDFQYKITDSHYGDEDSGNSVTSDWIDGHFTITATPVTDQPGVSITAIDGGSTTPGNQYPDDDAEPDTAVLTAADTVTVSLNIVSPDHDGSEYLIRVIVDGVPQGVSVSGAEFLGGGRWLLAYEGPQAKAINEPGGLGLDVDFIVSEQAGELTNHSITMTVQVQDRGDETGQTTEILSDSVTWHLTTDFEVGDESNPPAVIAEWEYTDAQAQEDTKVKLSTLVNGKVELESPGAVNTFTILLEDIPAGTVVTGMTRTLVTEGGATREVWTASATTTPGMTQEDAQALLDALLDSIELTPPADSNNNNAPGAFTFQASLTTSVAGGRDTVTESISPVVEVEPRTDDAQINIVLGDVTESDAGIPITVTVSNPADGSYGSIVGGNLYLRIDAANDAMEGGTLRHGAEEYELQAVSGVDGITNGDYYVIPNVEMDDVLALTYEPPAGNGMVAGNVTVDVWVLNTETGDNSANPVKSSTNSGSVSVEIINDGVTVTNNATDGDESSRGEAAENALIKLDLSVELKDTDTSEEIISILLSNLPVGFLVYTGTDASNASLASMSNNAGGSGGFNTWVISGADGSLPPYVGILPPAYWSGTLGDLQLIVESGETALSDKLVQTFDLEPVVVKPVANGIVITPTSAFGPENSVISLNLNAAMQDMVSAGSGDENTETATLRITGLGEHASFYIQGALIHQHETIQITSSGSGQATVYTISGLQQEQLDKLGFKQARASLVDQSEDDGGLQIKVEGWTVERDAVTGQPVGDSSGNPDEGFITLSVSGQLGTTGNDTLIWTGEPIDGRSGSDTVQMRYGENLTGAQLAANLRNIEAIDMGIAGANAITGLTPEQLKAIAGSGSSLTISGSAGDSLSLSGPWVDNGNGTYTGTIPGGSGGADTVVTLTVSGGVAVDTASIDSLDGMMFSPFGLTMGEDAFIDTEEDESDPAEASGDIEDPESDTVDITEPGDDESGETDESSETDESGETDGQAPETPETDADPESGDSGSLGLGNLGDGDADIEDDDFLFGDDGETPGLDIVLPPQEASDGEAESWLVQDEDESGGLPVEPAGAGASGSYPEYDPAPVPMPLNDDLQHDLQSGAVVG
ncbi:cadherin-like domain-containing protein, partial [Alcaligenaceae bacterium]|nr:cadherin-like domain-containing protein [Alcaligenaceae bacterium]